MKMNPKQARNKQETQVKKEMEAILFLSEEGVEIKRLASFFNLSEKDILRYAEELIKKHQEADAGVSLVQDGRKIQMVSEESTSAAVKDFYNKKDSSSLGDSALEVLAIIVYRGPISRAGVDYIRGVNSHLAIRKLSELGLIEKEDNPSDSRSYLYRAGIGFLKKAGLNKLEDLPEYDKLSKEFSGKDEI